MEYLETKEQCFQGVIWSDFADGGEEGKHDAKEMEKLMKGDRGTSLGRNIGRCGQKGSATTMHRLDCVGFAVPEAQTLAETGAGVSSGFGVSMGSEAATEDMPFSFALDEYAVNCLFCYKRLEMFLFPGNENRGPPFL